MKCYWYASTLLFVSYVYAASEPSARKITTAEQVLIGGCAGTVETLVNHPLFTLKNRAQQAGAHGSPRDALMRTIKDVCAHPRSLYSGVTANAASMVPTTAIQVGLQKVITGVLPTDTIGQQILSSALAGAGGAPTCSAVELCIVQKQNAEKMRQSRVPMAAIVAEVYRRQGLRGFMRGVTATIPRESGWAVGYLALPEILRSYTSRMTDSSVVAGTSALAGAALITCAATQPFDTIKTRLQSDVHRERYRCAIDAARQLYKAEGVGGFFKGFGWRATRMGAAIALITYTQKQMKRIIVDEEVE